MGRMIRWVTALAVVSGLGLSHSAAANERVSRQVEVTDQFVESDLSWMNEIGVGYQFRWKAIVVDGKFEICGAGAFHPSAALQSRRVMSKAWITFEGRHILKDVTYFARVPWGKPIVGAKANCAATGVAVPRGAWTVYLDWPSSRARF